MAGVLQGVVVIVGLIAAILHIIRVLIGEEGEQKAKDRLADWYVLVGAADFSILVESAARNTEQLLKRRLGEKSWTWRAYFRWLAVAAMVGIPTGMLLIRAFAHGSPESAFGEILISIIVVLALSPFDFIFLVCSRWLFKRIEEGRGAKAGVLYLILVYGAFTLTTSITVYAIIGFSAVSNGHPFPRFPPEEILYFLLRGLEWPYVIWFYPPTLLFIIPLMLSTLLFGMVILGALLMRQFRSILQPFAVWLIYRLGSSKPGPFKSAEVEAAAISGIFTAAILFMRFVKW